MHFSCKFDTHKQWLNSEYWLYSVNYPRCPIIDEKKSAIQKNILAMRNEFEKYTQTIIVQQWLIGSRECTFQAYTIALIWTWINLSFNIPIRQAEQNMKNIFK